MSDYIGKICPFCKTPLTAEDEVVVCSNCEMPHHKECWIENRGCTTFGCQGTIQGAADPAVSNAPKYSIRDASPQYAEQPLYCSNCGALLDAGHAFCGKCGTPASVSASSSAKPGYSRVISKVTEKVSSDLETVMENYKTSDDLDPELEAYIGSKKEYYLSVFASLKQNKKYASWNWAAFVLAPFWCLYRKMYIPGTVVLLIDIVLALLGRTIAAILGVAVAAAVGAFANYFYMYDLEQRMAKGKYLPEPQRAQYILQHGDTNSLIPSAAAVVFVLICVFRLI